MGHKGWLAAAGLGAVVLAAGIAGQVLPGPADPTDKPALGLFASLPIYWGEVGGIGEALDGGSKSAHWVRTALERDNRLVPLDTLDGEDLKGLGRLVMAQPRPLAPIENVALDDWVRSGGKVLLFADPMLTEHSRFALGDRRRPQDIAVLSPILRRWGLELQFDENQPDRPRVVTGEELAVPVQLSGTLAKVDSAASGSCEIKLAGLMATCTVGKGAVTVIADAEMLDREGGGGDASKALAAVMALSLR